ncbi:hypothetical protein EI94DRAFT_605306 [Lactarius quietus]|nr:hypothetical protein EI94DRAFT_605306 [Lactarius quietus]
MPPYNPYQRESRAYPREQKQVLPSHEQPQYTPYIQGVSRVAIPSSYSGSTLPALNLHRGDTSSLASHEELSQIMPVIDSDQSFFDEPPPPYTNNSLTVHPLGNAFQQPAIFSNDRFLSPMTSSPLAPVPLKHESPDSPLTGTLHSRVSSLAHALEPQDPQARQAPLPCASALGDRLGSSGISAPSPSATQTHTRSTSLNLATSPAVPCSNLVQVPSLALSAPAQMQSHVSSKTPPTARANAPSQNSSVITPSHSHTLAHPFQEATTHDYDTLPRLRKLQPALPGPGQEDHSAASTSTNDSKSPLESAFALPLLGRKRPVLRAKLACLFCRRRKIQCRPLLGDRQDNTCQQCAKRCRQCEYPETNWRGRGRKRSHSGDLEESEEEGDSPPLPKTRRQA